MKCPLCGYAFVDGETPLCHKCPLHKNCDLVCCPNCGYQWPQESQLLKWAKGMTSWVRAALNRWVRPIFSPRPLGPLQTPQVIRALRPRRQTRSQRLGDRLRPRAYPTDEDSLQRLSDLRVGEKARVFLVSSDSDARQHRLGSLGVVPGVVIQLQQKRPSFVVKVDETLLAMDRDVASQILVRVGNGELGPTRKGNGRQKRRTDRQD